MNDRCDDDVYRNGRLVAVIADRSAYEIEKIVRSVAEQTGEKIDWFWAGGRAAVKVVGDVKKVREAFRPWANSQLYFTIFEEDGSWSK